MIILSLVLLIPRCYRKSGIKELGFVPTWGSHTRFRMGEEVDLTVLTRLSRQSGPFEGFSLCMPQMGVSLVDLCLTYHWSVPEGEELSLRQL